MLIRAMDGVPERIRMHQMVHFYNAYPAYAAGVAKEPGLDLSKVKKFARIKLDELFDATSEEKYK